MPAELDAQLLDYFAARDQQRADAVTGLLGRLSKRERALIREVAVHAYTLGMMAGRAGVATTPADSAVLADTVIGCLSMPDLNPIMARVARRRPRSGSAVSRS